MKNDFIILKLKSVACVGFDPRRFSLSIICDCKLWRYSLSVDDNKLLILN